MNEVRGAAGCWRDLFAKSPEHQDSVDSNLNTSRSHLNKGHYRAELLMQLQRSELQHVLSSASGACYLSLFWVVFIRNQLLQYRALQEMTIRWAILFVYLKKSKSKQKPNEDLVPELPAVLREVHKCHLTYGCRYSFRAPEELSYSSSPCFTIHQGCKLQYLQGQGSGKSEAG